MENGSWDFGWFPVLFLGSTIQGLGFEFAGTRCLGISIGIQGSRSGVVYDHDKVMTRRA